MAPSSWLLLGIAALGIGITKSGLSGVSLVHVLVFAYVFGARASTGIVLPMLIAGDVMAMLIYGKDADWRYVRKMMPPAILGVICQADKESSCGLRKEPNEGCATSPMERHPRSWPPKNACPTNALA